MLVDVGHSTPVSTVIVLSNMVTIEDLSDPDEYDDILQDVRDECSR